MSGIDVLLVLPPMYHTGRIPDCNPKEPLGLMYLAAFLRKQGRKVEIFDADLNALSIKDTVEKILNSKASVIGFSTLQRALPSAKLIVNDLRNMGSKAHVCFGGFSATLSARIILEEVVGVDSIVMGEGELVFSDLVSAILTGNDWRKISGVTYRCKGNLVINSKSVKPELDLLPRPSRDLLSTCLEKTGYATILSSRGCYGSCTFCSNSSFEKFSEGCKWRGRDPVSVVDEVEYLHKEFGVHAFKFNDPNIFGPGKSGRDHVVQICQNILKRKLELSLMAFCRANDLDVEIAQMMRRSGFERLLLGIESSSQPVLSMFRKGESVTVIKRAMSIMKSEKIDLVAGFMIFNPYSTISTLKEDLAFLEDNNLFPTIAKALRVFDGTPIQETLAVEGRLTWRNPFEGYHEYSVSRDLAAIYMALKMFSVKWIDPFYKECQSAIWEMKKSLSFNARDGYYKLGKLIFQFNSAMLKALIFWIENGFTYGDIYSQTQKTKDEFVSILAHLKVDGSRIVLNVGEMTEEIFNLLKRKEHETFPEKYRWNDD